MEERSVWMEGTVKDILTAVFSERMFSFTKVWQYTVCPQGRTLHVIHAMAILNLHILRIASLN